jgi:hypothetical protein
MKNSHAFVMGVCIVAAAAFAADGPRPAYKFREHWVEGVPKEWGHLVNATMFTDGSSAMFFEASDGTIRRVGARFLSGDAVQWGTHVTVIGRP